MADPGCDEKHVMRRARSGVRPRAPMTILGILFTGVAFAIANATSAHLYIA